MTSHPLDAMTAAPDHHRILFENDSVRVLDTSCPLANGLPSTLMNGQRPFTC